MDYAAQRIQKLSLPLPSRSGLDAHRGALVTSRKRPE